MRFGGRCFGFHQLLAHFAGAGVLDCFEAPTRLGSLGLGSRHNGLQEQSISVDDNRGQVCIVLVQ
jgi:hypothetical protein